MEGHWTSEGRCQQGYHRAIISLLQDSEGGGGGVNLYPSLRDFRDSTPPHKGSLHLYSTLLPQYIIAQSPVLRGPGRAGNITDRPIP